MEIKILGAGCAKCKTLEKLANTVVKETGVNASVTSVEDIVEIMSYNVMMTPALVIDDKVVLKGRLPTKDEITDLITK
ncbi:MAG: thioredoxin family protein [Bacteroidetes bacterium]|nr:thioredoxin family protein [Bacteroidota bacterium]